MRTPSEQAYNPAELYEHQDAPTVDCFGIEFLSTDPACIRCKSSDACLSRMRNKVDRPTNYILLKDIDFTLVNPDHVLHTAMWVDDSVNDAVAYISKTANCPSTQLCMLHLSTILYHAQFEIVGNRIKPKVDSEYLANFMEPYLKGDYSIFWSNLRKILAFMPETDRYQVVTNLFLRYQLKVDERQQIVR